uniref:Uncharacterized protein n=1 Tax=Globodera rostochiensis TaxID=31243 RepID=A0A914HXA3_GLORO
MSTALLYLFSCLLFNILVSWPTKVSSDDNDGDKNCAFCLPSSADGRSPIASLHHRPLLANGGRCVRPGTALFKWPEECPLPQLRSRQVSLDPFSGIVFAEQRHCARRTQNDYWTVAVEVRCSDAQMWRNAKMKISLAIREQQKLRSLAKRWLRRRNPRNSRIHFKEDKYVVELPENAPVRSVIVQVQAHNEADQPLYYAFGVPEDSRSANLFSLDTVSGEVRLVKALDRETQQRHVLKVVAFERLDPSQSATVSAIVEVLDVQDNAPSFEKATYVAEIREDAPIGTTVLSVFARDFDDGANGEVSYSLKNVKDGPELAHLFSINSKSGVVQTAAQLDHESLPPLQLLQAIATDAGQPPMRSSANLEISVLDVNDNAPLFELNGTACEANVSEDAPVPSAILHPRARDADSGANGKVHYSIVTMSAPLFSIDYESGQVTLRHRATPKQSPLTLLIRAKDGGQPSLFSTLQCSVTIIDVNDHSPAFIGIGTTGGDRLELFVDENAPIGREIGRLLAVDGDSGQNGEIRYRIAAVLEENKGKVPPPPLPFELDPITGAFKTTEKLDRESRAEFIFNVLATDGGEPSRNASIEIKIRVKDINDNSPFFPQTFYQVELEEDAPRGHKLLSLRAQDADEGDSQKLTYRLVRQTPAAADLFALTNMGQEQGAVLSLAREFSPEDDKFLLEISATDEDGLSGHCNVSIKVKDVNRPPRIVPHQFLIRIDENAPIGAPVAKMEATDEDRGDNARLKFAINSAEFGIDPQNGLITVREALDREKQPVYTVDVRVEDGGNPSLSAGTLLEIVLDDVNDNVPHFLSAEYRASIPEDIPVGTSFLQVHAEDPDEGPNGQIDYLLDSDDPFVRMDRFRLDRTSGTLRVNQPLDRENVSKFVLPLIGRDRGSPRPLSTRTLVEVTVEDVNDNAPNFEFPSYDFYVPENSPAGTLVGELSADDPDLGENARIEFRIFGGTDAKFFELDRDQSEEQHNNKGTVRIRTRQQFDFEATQNKFSVELQATSGQLSTTVPVRVHILDVNDHPPQLADPFVVLVAQFVGDDGGQDEEWPELARNTTIGQVPAFDPDQNATLEFAIEKNSLIDVHPQTGILTLLYANWQRQIDSEQRICVSDGPNIACAKALFHLVPVSTELLRSSAVSVFVESVRQDELLSSGTFLRFLQAISSLWDWAVPENIRVFSLDEEHRRHANGTQLAGTVVNLFINRHSEMGEESAISSWLVEDAIEELRTNLSALFGAPLHLKRESLCVSEPCPYFQRCRSALRFLRLQDTLSTDDFIFRPISTLRTFNCECPRGFTTNASVPGECNQRLNQCFNGPCLHGGTCHPLEGGFRCACRAGRTGKNCELATFGLITCLPGFCFSGAQCQIQMPDRSPACVGCPWRPIDSDERCRLRSVSFGGDSFLAVPKAPSRMEWTFGLSFATISSAGTLFFAGSADGDFVHLYLEGGVPQIQFSLGGNDSFGGKLADIKANFVNDGDWHSVKLQYSEWKMRLSVDNCDVQSSLLLGTLSNQCAVEVAVPLAKKCLLDTAVPCHRFLDLPKSLMIGGFGPSGAKKFVGIPFVGVVKDLRLDGQLVHFSNWEQLERVGPNIWPGAEKYRPDRCLMPQEKSLCPEQTRCLDRWLGHHCRCHLRVHSPDLNCPSLQAGQEAPALTMAEDSFAVWSLPSEFSLPFSLHFEFRTRERKTQVITLDFELSAQMLIFSLENGQSIIRVNSEQYLLPYPALADGNWHSVDAHFTIEALEIVVDALYKKAVPLMALSTPRTVHSGTVPSSAHPAAFFGCIRNVEWDGQRLRLANQSATRQSCLAPNVCQMAATQCPVNSKCVRDWDRHNCKCNLGYIGDSCVDACAVPNICGPFPNTICVRLPNAPRGYECVCPDGRTGQNCENVALPAECPEGWFGQFPKCKRCLCPFENAFATQCNSTNGQCICREGTFLVSNLAGLGSEHRRCVLCRCGYGTAPGALERCDRHSGQCNCVGDATGRQCDRCEQNPASNKKLLPLLLERRSLKCVPIHGRCPSQMELDVQWPTTAEGTTARHSCSQPMMGIATRLCSENGIWSHVNDFNCTLPSLFELQNRIFESDAQNAQLFDWSRRLANVTRQNRHDLRGENVQIVAKLLNELVRLEMAKNGTNSAGEANGGGVESARGNHFALNLLHVADILLAVLRGEELSHHKLAINLANYGAFLTDLYERFRFLRPFKFGGKNLVFVIDKLAAKVSPVVVTLPPIGDSLFRHRHQISHANAAVRLQLEFAHHPPTNVSSVRIFYSAFISGSKKDFSTVLSLYASKEIVTILNTLNIALPIADPFGHYECMAKYAEGHWQNVHLVGLNGTHAQCQIARGDGQGKWPLFIKAIANQKSAGVKFFPFAGCNRVHYSTVFSPIPIICTLCAMFAFALLALAFAIALCRQNRRYRMLRCTVIAAFSLNALCVQLSRRVLPADNDGLFCAALNSILAASICALFAWLLLYSLFLCKLILQSADKNCSQTWNVTFGVILPFLVSVAVFIMPTKVEECRHVPIGSAPFWLLTVPPAILCLLNFYSLATSWMLSWHKQYQLIVLRFSFRRVHFSHSVLVFLCAILSIMDLLQLFRPFPSQIFAILNAVLLAFIAIHFVLWANFFIATPKEDNNAHSSTNSDKSAESIWMAREAEAVHQAPVPVQSQLMCPDSSARANFYVNSPFHRGISPFTHTAKRRPRLSDGKVYEGIPNEWIPPGGEGGGSLTEEPTYLHHTLQRSLEVGLPQILSPPQHPAPPSSMVDGNWPLEVREQQPRQHFLSGTLPIGGASNFVHYSPLQKQFGLKQRRHHYGSVHAIDRNEMTPNTRRRTQPIQFPAAHNGSLKNVTTESTRNRKFGLENVLDDELNCAYFTFTRRRDQLVVDQSASLAATTFN